MKLLQNTSILLALLLIAACTPKVAEKVVEQPKPDPKPKEQLVENPCTTLYELSAAKKEEAENAYAVYRDYIKIKDFKTAFELWSKAYYLAPAANGKIKYQFEDGIKIYKSFYDEATDPTTKKMHYDSIMAIYDKRAECYPEPGYIEGRKAFDMYYYYSAQSDQDEIYDLFKKAIDIKKEKADYFIINPLTGILADRLINEKVSLEEGRKYATLLLQALEYGNANCGTKCETWEIINDYAPARLESLEGMKGLYGCDYYEAKYFPEFKADPANCETLSRVYARMSWGGCAPDGPALTEMRQAKATNCYTPPTGPGPLQQAFDLYNEGKYDEAILGFESFVETTEDINKKAKYTLLIAKIYYGDLKKFSKSRTYARKAAKFRSNWGEPYILIGKLYASSGPLCGPGRGWDSQVVTWAAIDKFKYAKKIDSESAEEANKWINTYTQYMPSKEDVFQRNLKPGQAFTVPCWIQEQTTIRTAD